MSNVLGIWHVVLRAGNEEVFRAPATIQITNISYGEEIVDENSRSVVKLKFASLLPDDDDEGKGGDGDLVPEETTVLCALTPGKIEHAAVNITLGSDEDYKLQVTGKNTVYLTGNYIHPGTDIDSELDSDEEEAYDLREVSSDVEMHPDDLGDLESDGDRFEEVKDDEEAIKPNKRLRESDAAEGNIEKVGKKKLKAEGGKVVPVETSPVQDKPKKEKKKKEKKGEDKKKESKSEDAQKDEPAKKTITGGIVIQNHKTGNGPMAKKGDTVKMRYIGKLTNGKEFDKNVGGKPFIFQLGQGDVIKGWDEGIVGMQAGGERVLTIPPSMGYGKRAKEGIPANSTLVFEVKLLEIKS